MINTPHRDPTADRLWPVGRVASLLGVPAVTLRSWERRYGIGPSQRSPGQHRRYNSSDIERLNHMRNLIAAGIAPRDAARLSATSTADTDSQTLDAWADLETRGIIELATALQPQALAVELTNCLARRGLLTAWEHVIRPALRLLEARYLALRDCTDIEIVLTQAVGEAVDRYLDLRQSAALDLPHPVLLVCSPGERHHLPLKILHGVLLDQAVPAVLLGPGLPADAVTAAIERVVPSVVVLWALTSRPATTAFHHTIAGLGVAVCVAGPGWTRTTHPITGLAAAANQVSGLWFRQATGAAAPQSS